MPRHGENIYKRNDGRWEGRYRYKGEEGTTKYKSIYGKTYSEVKERMNSLLMQCYADNRKSQSCEQIPSGKTVSNKISFIEVSEKWLIFVQETKKYSTYIKYLKLYEHYIKSVFQDAYISDFSNDFVNSKLFGTKSDQKISANMKHSILRIINQILEYASEYCQCPLIKLYNKYPKDRSVHIEIINHSDQALLLKYLYQDMDASKAGIILCISTGLRLGEICSLKWKDIDLEQMILYVNSTVQRIALIDQERKTMLMTTPPKSVFSIREIPFSKELKNILLQIKETNQEYVIGGNKPMEPRTYQNRFKRYLRDAKLKDYNFHILRHTFATNCIDRGMDVKSLSEILGHSDVQITLNRYVHPSIDTKRKYIAALSSFYGQFSGQRNHYTEN